MADIDILHADMNGDRIQQLEVRIQNTRARHIDRATAVTWAREGHSLIPVHGHGHDVARGHALTLIEVGDDVYLRTDTRAEASDSVHFPGH